MCAFQFLSTTSLQIMSVDVVKCDHLYFLFKIEASVLNHLNALLDHLNALTVCKYSTLSIGLSVGVYLTHIHIFKKKTLCSFIFDVLVPLGMFVGILNYLTPLFRILEEVCQHCHSRLPDMLNCYTVEHE